MTLKLSTNPNELRKQFYSLKNAQDVADILQIPLERLYYHIYIVPESSRYTTFEISKRTGGSRTISAPVTALKLIQRKLNQVLLCVYQPKPSVHSYLHKRSVVTNAKVHLGRRHILNIDLLDFFPSINFGRVRGLLMGKPYNIEAAAATILAQVCCFNNQLPQGSPTSPIVSNMICGQLDSQLTRISKVNKCDYTRYADDITFSTNQREFPSALAEINDIGQVQVGKELESIITQNGFQINPNKVRLRNEYRRHQVTGIITNKVLNVRRVYIYQIRSMLHAWEKFGLENAQKEFWNQYNYKHRHPSKNLPQFVSVIKGKIDFLGMVRGKDNNIYINLYRRLWALAPGYIKKLPQPLESLSKAIVYCEGKTDKRIFCIAWEKLYVNQPMPFQVKECDPVESNKMGGAGGADTLSKILETVRYDSAQIILGIFDRDHEGIEKYNKLPKRFKKVVGLDAKVADHDKAVALLLPIPKGKEKYAEYQNLCTEFYFSEQALKKKTKDGKCLVFRFPKIKTTVERKGAPILEQKLSDIPETREIKAGKTEFANKIVHSLVATEFENFRILFEKIEGVLIYCFQRVKA